MFVRRAWPLYGLRGTLPDVDRLTRDLGRLAKVVSGAEPDAAGVFPPMNVTQDDNNFFVRAELPGIKPDELDLKVLGNKLSLAGKRELPKEAEGVSYHRRERAEGAFSRSMVLPSEVNADEVEAKYLNGILTITLPKAEATKPRQVTVATQ